MRFSFFLFIFSFISCVDIAVVEKYSTKNVALPYTKLDEDGFISESAHFKVRAYSYQIAERYSNLAEQLYTTIMNDTGLYSFVPKNPYEIIVYKDQSEFVKKTSSPQWSGGITYGNAILLYEQERYPAIIAHEMTHLIFNEFMEDYGGNSYIWLNEGLAVYEERKAFTDSNFYYHNIIDQKVKNAPLSFLQMTSYKPVENSREVDKWYAQCSSVVDYILKNGGNFKFYIFLKNLKSGMDIDSALKDAYIGMWNNFSELEKKWFSSL